MAKGHHKGKERVFTNPRQLEDERIEEEMKKQRARVRRIQRGEETDEEEDEEVKESGSESSSEEEKKPKAKGPSAFLEINNPNHVKPILKKVSKLTLHDGQTHSNYKREAADKERARLHYQKLHAEGKTVEAQSDLARLAVIRKQREDAAKKREEERKAKQSACHSVPSKSKQK